MRLQLEVERFAHASVIKSLNEDQTNLLKNLKITIIEEGKDNFFEFFLDKIETKKVVFSDNEEMTLKINNITTKIITSGLFDQLEMLKTPLFSIQKEIQSYSGKEETKEDNEDKISKLQASVKNFKCDLKLSPTSKNLSLLVSNVNFASHKECSPKDLWSLSCSLIEMKLLQKNPNKRELREKKGNNILFQIFGTKLNKQSWSQNETNSRTQINVSSVLCNLPVKQFSFLQQISLNLKKLSSILLKNEISKAENSAEINNLSEMNSSIINEETVNKIRFWPKNSEYYFENNGFTWKVPFDEKYTPNIRYIFWRKKGNHKITKIEWENDTEDSSPDYVVLQFYDETEEQYKDLSILETNTRKKKVCVSILKSVKKQNKCLYEEDLSNFFSKEWRLLFYKNNPSPGSEWPSISSLKIHFENLSDTLEALEKPKKTVNQSICSSINHFSLIVVASLRDSCCNESDGILRLEFNQMNNLLNMLQSSEGSETSFGMESNFHFLYKDYFSNLPVLKELFSLEKLNLKYCETLFDGRIKKRANLLLSKEPFKIEITPSLVCLLNKVEQTVKILDTSTSKIKKEEIKNYYNLHFINNTKKTINLFRSNNNLEEHPYIRVSSQSISLINDDISRFPNFYVYYGNKLQMKSVTSVSFKNETNGSPLLLVPSQEDVFNLNENMNSKKWDEKGIEIFLSVKHLGDKSNTVEIAFNCMYYIVNHLAQELIVSHSFLNKTGKFSQKEILVSNNSNVSIAGAENTFLKFRFNVMNKTIPSWTDEISPEKLESIPKLIKIEKEKESFYFYISLKKLENKNIITLFPTFLFENETCSPLEIFLSSNQINIQKKIEVKEKQSLMIFPKQKIFLKMKINFNWSREIEILENDSLQTFNLVDKSENQKESRMKIHLFQTKQENTKYIRFVNEYTIENKTSFDLHVSRYNVTKEKNLETIVVAPNRLKGFFWSKPQEKEEINMVLIGLQKDKKGLIISSAKITHDMFERSNNGNSLVFIISILNWNEPKLNQSFGKYSQSQYIVTVEKEKTSYMNKITFEPRYLFKNTCNFDLLIRQSGSDQVFSLKKGDTADFCKWFLNNTTNYEIEQNISIELMCSKLNRNEWSKPITIQLDNSFVVEFKHQTNFERNWIFGRVTLDYEQDNKYRKFPCPITITFMDIVAPFHIYNYTKHKIYFMEKSNERNWIHQIENSCSYSFFPLHFLDFLSSGAINTEEEKSDFVQQQNWFPVDIRKRKTSMRIRVEENSNWSEKIVFLRPKHMLITLYSPKKSYVLKLTLNYHNECRYLEIRTLPQKIVSKFYFSTNNKEIESLIQKEEDLEIQLSPFKKKYTKSNIILNRNISISSTNNEYQNEEFEYQMQIPLFFVNFVNDNIFMRVLMKNVSLLSKNEIESHQKISQISISDYQIENKIEKAKYEIMTTSRSENKSNCFVLTTKTREGESRNHFSNITLHSSSIYINLDYESLQKIGENFTKLFEKQNKEEKKTNKSNDSIFIDRFEIEQFSLYLCWMNPKEFLPKLTFIKELIPDNTIPWDAFLSIKDLHLKIGNWLHEKCSMTLSELLWQLLTQYLAKQFLTQIPKILGSLDVTGNISGVVSSLINSFKQFKRKLLKSIGKNKKKTVKIKEITNAILSLFKGLTNAALISLIGITESSTRMLSLLKENDLRIHNKLLNQTLSENEFFLEKTFLQQTFDSLKEPIVSLAVPFQRARKFGLFGFLSG